MVKFLQCSQCLISIIRLLIENLVFMLEVGSSGLAACWDGNLCGGQGSDGERRWLLLVLESFLVSVTLYYYGYFISSILLSLIRINHTYLIQNWWMSLKINNDFKIESKLSLNFQAKTITKFTNSFFQLSHNHWINPQTLIFLFSQSNKNLLIKTI